MNFQLSTFNFQLRPEAAWPTALALSAAPLSTWRAGAGAQFVNLQPFLRPSPHLATTHPCRSSSPCLCEHEVRANAEGDLFAVCTCGECETFPVTPQDLTLYQLNLPRFSHALASALALEPMSPRSLLRGAHQFGYHGAARTPAALVLPVPPASIAETIAPLILQLGQPFLLLVPTADGLTPTAREHLARAQATVLDLQSHLHLAGPGQLEPTAPAVSLLAALNRSTVDLEHTEAGRIFRLMQLLESEPQQRKAPLLVVFRLLVLEGLTQGQVARRCKCAKSLLTLRVQALETRFRLSIPSLRAHAHALVDLGNEEKHNQRLRVDLRSRPGSGEASLSDG